MVHATPRTVTDVSIASGDLAVTSEKRVLGERRGFTGSTGTKDTRYDAVE